MKKIILVISFFLTVSMAVGRPIIKTGDSEYLVIQTNGFPSEISVTMEGDNQGRVIESTINGKPCWAVLAKPGMIITVTKTSNYQTGRKSVCMEFGISSNGINLRDATKHSLAPVNTGKTICLAKRLTFFQPNDLMVSFVPPPKGMEWRLATDNKVVPVTVKR